MHDGDHGHHVVFARTARADPKMVTGEGLGILSPLLKADANGRSAYLYMEQSDAFGRPITYGEIRAADFDALLLTGGHAPGMRVYLGSGVLQSGVADFFAQEKPVGAICHGVLLAARSSLHPGKSVLYGMKTTALTKQMELIAWRLTRFYLGDYYRTYQTTAASCARLQHSSASNVLERLRRHRGVAHRVGDAGMASGSVAAGACPCPSPPMHTRSSAAACEHGSEMAGSATSPPRSIIRATAIRRNG
jgi:putative intracellular protease/amidase